MMNKIIFRGLHTPLSGLILCIVALLIFNTSLAKPGTIQMSIVPDAAYGKDMCPPIEVVLERHSTQPQQLQCGCGVVSGASGGDSPLRLVKVQGNAGIMVRLQSAGVFLAIVLCIFAIFFAGISGKSKSIKKIMRPAMGVARQWAGDLCDVFVVFPCKGARLLVHLCICTPLRALCGVGLAVRAAQKLRLQQQLLEETDDACGGRPPTPSRVVTAAARAGSGNSGGGGSEAGTGRSAVGAARHERSTGGGGGGGAKGTDLKARRKAAATASGVTERKKEPPEARSARGVVQDASTSGRSAAGAGSTACGSTVDGRLQEARPRRKDKGEPPEELSTATTAEPCLRRQTDVEGREVAAVGPRTHSKAQLVEEHLDGHDTIQIPSSIVQSVEHDEKLATLHLGASLSGSSTSAEKTKVQDGRCPDENVIVSELAEKTDSFKEARDLTSCISGDLLGECTANPQSPVLELNNSLQDVGAKVEIPEPCAHVTTAVPSAPIVCHDTSDENRDVKVLPATIKRPPPVPPKSTTTQPSTYMHMDASPIGLVAAANETPPPPPPKQISNAKHQRQVETVPPPPPPKQVTKDKPQSRKLRSFGPPPPGPAPRPPPGPAPAPPQPVSPPSDVGGAMGVNFSSSNGWNTGGTGGTIDFGWNSEAVIQMMAEQARLNAMGGTDVQTAVTVEQGPEADESTGVPAQLAQALEESPPPLSPQDGSGGSMPQHLLGSPGKPAPVLPEDDVGPRLEAMVEDLVGVSSSLLEDAFSKVDAAREALSRVLSDSGLRHSAPTFVPGQPWTGQQRSSFVD